MKDTAGMLGGRLAGMRVDGHAADRVAHGLVGDGDATVHAVVVAGMVVMAIVMLVGFHDVLRMRPSIRRDR